MLAVGPFRLQAAATGRRIADDVSSAQPAYLDCVTVPKIEALLASINGACTRVSWWRDNAFAWARISRKVSTRKYEEMKRFDQDLRTVWILDQMEVKETQRAHPESWLWTGCASAAVRRPSSVVMVGGAAMKRGIAFVVWNVLCRLSSKRLTRGGHLNAARA